jgi:hypothetical protein
MCASRWSQYCGDTRGRRRRRCSFAHAKEIPMDGTRFDHLTRRLAQPLPRRRLLQWAAGGLAGALPGRRAARTLAACDPLPQCPPGYKPCKDCTCEEGCPSCIPEDGHCCTENTYCPAHTTCCGSPAKGWSCCEDSQQFCCGGNAVCCLFGQECGEGGCLSPCSAGTTRCGADCCGAGTSCEAGKCVRSCPAGTTKCGTACCTAGETCVEDTTCVAACPAGRAAGRGVAAEAGCEPPPPPPPPPPCPKGTVKCGKTCVAPCKPKRGKPTTLDGVTCKCRKTKCPTGETLCDGECIDTLNDPTNCGGCADGGGGVTCADEGAICCNGQCREKGTVCCGTRACRPGTTCCGRKGDICCAPDRCCGNGCCPPGSYCADSAHSICCPTGHTYCNKECCFEGLVCANFQDSVCCAKHLPVYCRKSGKCVSDRRKCK